MKRYLCKKNSRSCLLKQKQRRVAYQKTPDGTGDLATGSEMGGEWYEHQLLSGCALIPTTTTRRCAQTHLHQSTATRKNTKKGNVASSNST